MPQIIFGLSRATFCLNDYCDAKLNSFKKSALHGRIDSGNGPARCQKRAIVLLGTTGLSAIRKDNGL